MILESKFNLEDTVYYLKDNRVTIGTINSLYVEARKSGLILTRYFVIDAWVNEELLYKSRKELATAIIGEDLDE